MLIMRKLTSSAHCCSAAVASPVFAQSPKSPELSVEMPEPEPTCTAVGNDDELHELVMETPISAPWPPSSASSEKCSKLSKSVRRLQKENSYLRKRNRELKERVKNVNTFSDLIQQSIFMARIRNHYNCFFIWLFQSYILEVFLLACDNLVSVVVAFWMRSLRLFHSLNVDKTCTWRWVG